jgi:hypothetical protein
LSLPSRLRTPAADVVVNARVAIDPGELESAARRAVSAAAQPLGGRIDFRQSQSLRPGRPTPTHRYPAAVN